jgi:hypothetical protein
MASLRFFCILLAATAALVQAQTNGTGRTDVPGQSFDPSKVVYTPPEFQDARLLPEHVANPGPGPHPARDPRSFSGPPMLQTIDRKSPNAPSVVVRAPVQTNPTQKWEGTSTEFNPGDPDLAVGPEDVIAVMNPLVVQHNRAGQLISQRSLFTWFRPFIATICPNGTINCLLFDPMISYDQLHGRFLIVAVALDFVSFRSHWLLTVSNGATYAGGWTSWIMDGSMNGSIKSPIFIDYPKIGYDNEAIYLTANTFGYNFEFLYTKLRILKKSEVYKLQPTLTFWDSWDLKNQSGIPVSTLYPPRMRGRTMASYSSYYLVNSVDASQLLTLWRVSSPASPNPMLFPTTVTGAWFYDKPARVPQKDYFVPLDIGDSGVQKAILRDGNLYVARNTGYADEPITVTYDRVDTRQNRLVAQTRWTNGYFFFPAFDIPASLGTTANFPNVLTVGTNTRNRELTLLGITGLKDGELLNFQDRWGDYFGGAVDPRDGGLWVYGAFAKNLGGIPGWGTLAAYYPSSVEQRFTDTPPTHDFYESAHTIALWGITLGCTAPDKFCPDDTVTRGQMAAFLVRSLMDENFTYVQTPYFKDVPASNPFFKYVQKLRELGITVGCRPPDEYCPNDPVTRGQAATFIIKSKFWSLFGDNITFPQTPYFTDVPAENGFFPYVQKLRELGITTGCGETIYCTDAPLTRGQMSKFLQRAFLN